MQAAETLSLPLPLTSNQDRHDAATLQSIAARWNGPVGRAYALRLATLFESRANAAEPDGVDYV